MKLIQGKDKLTKMTSNSESRAGLLIENQIKMRRDKMKTVRGQRDR
jgi:hypothetical protein